MSEYRVTVTEEVEYQVTVHASNGQEAQELAEQAVIDEGDKWFHAVNDRSAGFTERLDDDVPHAVPSELKDVTTCKHCGAVLNYAGTDDNGVGIWEHHLTGDYFCEVPE